jgi:hypothetical protein
MTSRTTPRTAAVIRLSKQRGNFRPEFSVGMTTLIIQLSCRKQAPLKTAYCCMQQRNRGKEV